MSWASNVHGMGFSAIITVADRQSSKNVERVLFVYCWRSCDALARAHQLKHSLATSIRNEKCSLAVKFSDVQSVFFLFFHRKRPNKRESMAAYEYAIPCLLLKYPGISIVIIYYSISIYSESADNDDSNKMKTYSTVKWVLRTRRRCRRLADILFLSFLFNENSHLWLSL